MRLLGVGLLLVAVGLVVLAWSRLQRARAGMPSGEVVYADTQAWERCERPLYSQRYRLSGKPDYLVRERRHVVPVEVKPGRRAREPYEGDILQLAAYCLLVAEEFGQRPRYGYLKYQQQVFRIDYSQHLERELLHRLQTIRQHGVADDVPVSHREPRRCRACGHREQCDQRLA
jgi:CRISPR-associated exonuclease Cas4